MTTIVINPNGFYFDITQVDNSEYDIDEMVEQGCVFCNRESLTIILDISMDEVDLFVIKYVDPHGWEIAQGPETDYTWDVQNYIIEFEGY